MGKGDDNSLIGGFCGYAQSSTITNCFAEGSVSDDISALGDYGVVGGFVALSEGSTIENCTSRGSVNGKAMVGGFAAASIGGEITNCTSYSKTTAVVTETEGSFVGVVMDGMLPTINNCNALEGKETIGCCVDDEFNPIPDYDLTELRAKIQPIQLPQSSAITLQVGINSSSDSQITFQVGVDSSLISALQGLDLSDSSSLNVIDDFIRATSQKSTELGVVQNRLESALESISVSIENLASSRSTMRDADITKESSAFIKNQILQQASATLLATTNQQPAIALTLLQGVR